MKPQDTQTLRFGLEVDDLLKAGRGADLVYGVWDRHDDDPEGVGHMILKGESRLRDVLWYDDAVEIKQITLICKNHDQAKALANLIGGKPLDPREIDLDVESSAKEGSASSGLRQNWKSTPQRRLLRCVSAKLHQDGSRGSRLVDQFKKLVPDYQRHFEKPISDKAIIQRGDCAWRYDSENPTTNGDAEKYWPLAEKIVDENVAVNVDVALRGVA